MLYSLQYHQLGVSRQGKVIKFSHSSLPKKRGRGHLEAAEGKTIYISVLHLPSQVEVHLVGFSPLSFSWLQLYWKRLPACKKKKISIDLQATSQSCAERSKFKICRIGNSCSSDTDWMSQSYSDMTFVCVYSPFLSLFEVSSFKWGAAWGNFGESKWYADTFWDTQCILI